MFIQTTLHHSRLPLWHYTKRWRHCQYLIADVFYGADVICQKEVNLLDTVSWAVNRQSWRDSNCLRSREGTVSNNGYNCFHPDLWLQRRRLYYQSIFLNSTPNYTVAISFVSFKILISKLLKRHSNGHQLIHKCCDKLEGLSNGSLG